MGRRERRKRGLSPVPNRQEKALLAKFPTNAELQKTDLTFERLPNFGAPPYHRVLGPLLDNQTDAIMAAVQGAISKRRKFVADGVFYAELNEFFQRELAEEGYSGVEVRVTPTVTDIIIRATHTQEVLGEQGRRIRELTSLIQKRFKFPENSVSLYAAKVQNRGLSAVAQCESLRYKLLNGLAVRRACYGVLRFIMESGAKGCEVVVSGKLRAARAKSMKFTDGFMIHSGQPAKEFIDSATRHVLLRQGVLGIKVKIMRGSDPEGKAGPQKTLPDSVTIIEPKEEQPVLQPVSQDYVIGFSFLGPNFSLRSCYLPIPMTQK
ncbi:ribosomal protein S3 [Aspergillus heterothallicus]